MADTLWVATRKGLFRLEQQSQGTWRVGHVAFVGEPVSMMLDDPRDGTVYAALNLGHFGVKIHRSEDRGISWTEVPTPAYPQPQDPDAPPPARPDGRPGKPLALSMVWALEPAGPRAAEGLWMGTLPGGLFYSNDRGQSWSLNRGLWEREERKHWMGGGADDPGIHSICVDPRDPRHVLISVSCGGTWRTRDGGETWSQTAHGMVAEYMPPERQNDPDVQDPHRTVQCAGQPNVMWTQHHNGVFRSEDHGMSWQRVLGLKPSAFGFGVAVHPHDGQTAWFVPAVKDQTRIAVDGKLVVTRTRDGGKTCEVLSQGLPSGLCYDIVYRHALEVDSTGDGLAFGSTTGHLWTSANGGDSWQMLPHYLPPIYAVRFGA